MSGTAVIRSVLVPARPEEIWEALVDPARLEEWFADEVEAEALEPDAEVVFRWDDGDERRAVVEEVDAPRQLTFRWEAGGEESRVAFILEREEAGTCVTVVESGLALARGAWGPRMHALAHVAALAAA